MLNNDSSLQYLAELGERRKARVGALESVDDIRDLIADVINDMEGLYLILSDWLSQQQPRNSDFVPFSTKRD